MSLEHKVKKTRKVLSRVPSNEVMEQVHEGKKFIPVEDDFDTPIDGYTLLSMQYRGDQFKLLVPHSFLFYVANEGEGNIDDALDELGDFYEEAKDYEEDLIAEGLTNVQEANVTTDARRAYHTFLINKLVTPTREKDEEGEPIAEFNQKALEELDLTDEYIIHRVKGIAALALDLGIEEVKAYGVGDLLKHVTVMQNRTETLTRAEFDRVTCWAGSHYEIKKEYQNNPNISYTVERRHNKRHRVGTKTTRKKDFEVFNHEIGKLEQEITEYRMGKHGGKLGRHDTNLIRAYTNLQYIAKKDPTAQLDVIPARKPEEKNPE